MPWRLSQYICSIRLDKYPWILSCNNMFPYFTWGNGVLDGRHIWVIVLEQKRAPFRDPRSVFVIVDWYRHFICTFVEWEVIAHDALLQVDAHSKEFLLLVAILRTWRCQIPWLDTLGTNHKWLLSDIIKSTYVPYPLWSECLVCPCTVPHLKGSAHIYFKTCAKNYERMLCAK